MVTKALNITIKIDNSAAKKAAKEMAAAMASVAKAAQQSAAQATAATAKATAATTAQVQKGANQVAAIAQKGTNQVAAINAKGATSLASQVQKGTNAVNAIVAKGTASNAAIAQRGANTLNEINAKAGHDAEAQKQKAVDQIAAIDRKAQHDAALAAQRAAEAEAARNRRSADQAVRAAQRKADAAEAAANRQAAAMRIVEKASSSLQSAAMGVVTAYVGFNAITALVSGLADATERAASKQKELSDEVVRHRDAARELRSMEGVKGTTAETLKDAQFAAKTGMTMDESLAYRTSFMGSGAQYEGKTMSKDEFREFSINAGRLTTAQGIDAGVMGNLAGTIAGTQDYSKHGNQAGEMALGELNTMVKILQRGKGSNKQLADQASMLASYSLNPDETLGTFTNGRDLATALSTAAELNAGEGEVFTRAAIRGIRGFDDDQGELLARAGIDKKTGFFESFEKLAPIIEAETRADGGTQQDTIAKYFKDERVAKAVGTFVSKGVRGNVIKDRQEFAKTVEGPGPALNEIHQFETDVHGPGPLRRRNAEDTLSRLQQGSKSVLAETLIGEATTNLRDSGEIDTTNSNSNDAIMDYTIWKLHQAGNAIRYVTGMKPNAGIADNRKMRIFDKALNNLATRAKAAGKPFDIAEFYAENGGGEKELMEALNRRATQIDAMGVNVAGVMPAAGAAAPARGAGAAAAGVAGAGGDPAVAVLNKINAKIAPAKAPRPINPAKPQSAPRAP